MFLNKHRLHRLICEAFHGPCPEGQECRHLDGDPSNNRPENLVALTKQQHHKLHGTPELEEYHRQNPGKNRESGLKGAAARWDKAE